MPYTLDVTPTGQAAITVADDAGSREVNVLLKLPESINLSVELDGGELVVSILHGGSAVCQHRYAYQAHTPQPLTVKRGPGRPRKNPPTPAPLSYDDLMGANTPPAQR